MKNSRNQHSVWCIAEGFESSSTKEILLPVKTDTKISGTDKYRMLFVLFQAKRLMLTTEYSGISRSFALFLKLFLDEIKYASGSITIKTDLSLFPLG